MSFFAASSKFLHDVSFLTFIYIVFKCQNYGLYSILSLQYQKIKILMLGAVQYQNKGIQSGAGMLQFRTEMPDARMPMLAAFDLLPIPSYVENKDYLDVFLLDKIFR